MRILALLQMPELATHSGILAPRAVRLLSCFAYVNPDRLDAHEPVFFAGRAIYPLVISRPQIQTTR